jgi:hypothetical protein
VNQHITIVSWFPGFLIIAFLYFHYQTLYKKLVLVAIKGAAIRKPGMQEINNKIIY